MTNTSIMWESNLSGWTELLRVYSRFVTVPFLSFLSLSFPLSPGFEQCGFVLMHCLYVCDRVSLHLYPLMHPSLVFGFFSEIIPQCISLWKTKSWNHAPSSANDLHRLIILTYPSLLYKLCYSQLGTNNVFHSSSVP